MKKGGVSVTFLSSYLLFDRDLLSLLVNRLDELMGVMRKDSFSVSTVELGEFSRTKSEYFRSILFIEIEQLLKAIENTQGSNNKSG